jgi:hypothetical protein
MPLTEPQEKKAKNGSKSGTKNDLIELKKSLL